MIEPGGDMWYRSYGVDERFYKVEFVRFGEKYIHSHKGIETCVFVIMLGRLNALPLSLNDIRTEDPNKNKNK